MARPLDPVLDLGGQCGRAGLGHQPLEPMQVDPAPAVRSAASLSATAAAAAPPSADPSPMQVQPTLLAKSASIQPPAQSALAGHPSQPARAQQLDSVDVSMPQAALPMGADASVSSDFPDSPAASAMLLWAEEFDLPLTDARQAVLHVHAHHAKQIRQHATGSHVRLASPLQELMPRAVRIVTGDATFNKPSQPANAPHSKQQTASAAPRRSNRQHKPASQFWHVPPGPMGGHQ